MEKGVRDDPNDAGPVFMNADGTHLVRLTVASKKSGDFGDTDSNPDWQPLRH